MEPTPNATVAVRRSTRRSELGSPWHWDESFYGSLRGDVGQFEA
jgi:hypothetical protein